MTRRTAPIKKPDAILTADWHIRPDVPICRTDNYFESMEKKIDFILNLSKQYNCPILVAGDIGEWPLNNGWPTWLLEWTINKFQGHNIIAIPGQHDLPNHKLDLFEKSGMGVLDAAGVIKVIWERTFCWPDNYFLIEPFPYGLQIDHRPYSIEKEKPMIAMIHQMVIENKKLWPDQIAPKGNSLLKQFPEYDLILSGDNHQSFIVEHEGRLLVNPGSLMRNNADQESHKPRIYLWYAENNTVESVYLPIEQGVISREHIEIAHARDERFDALITRVQQDVEIKLSYEQNLESYFQKYRTEKSIKDKVWENVK